MQWWYLVFLTDGGFNGIMVAGVLDGEHKNGSGGLAISGQRRGMKGREDGVHGGGSSGLRPEFAGYDGVGVVGVRRRQAEQGE
ncbi:hypothetical protein HAX54_009005 [Datura stramonium]|uniref:Uncharacterized protein n=1 Tax=Datura stramonium TaxID=4076 RepID=A0ABS8TE74_DATST|nr:hypothetical protein [Datura stramonium]